MLVPVVVAVQMNILSDSGVEAVLVPVVVALRTNISSDLSEGVGVVLSFYNPKSTCFQRDLFLTLVLLPYFRA